MKQFLRKLYNVGTLPVEKRDYYQKIIRDTEWEYVEPYIPFNSKFLDVGCGAGYNLLLARKKGCDVYGVCPSPYEHGVCRKNNLSEKQNREVTNDPTLNIKQATAESLPFDDNSFDVVYCSHVLENTADKGKELTEVKRVLKVDGTLIIGMPTSSMSWINLFSQIIFTTHKRFIHLVAQAIGFSKTIRYRFINLFVPRSHSFASKTVFFDIRTYRIDIWNEIVGAEFGVRKVIKPALYPYPDFIQFLKQKRKHMHSSSVFFVCQKP